MTGEDVRAVLLGLEGVEEGAHMGHPDFRLRKRIFASLMANEARANVKLLPEEQAELLRRLLSGSPRGRGLGPQRLDVDHARGRGSALVRGALLMGWEAARTHSPHVMSGTSGRRAPSKQRRP